MTDFPMDAAIFSKIVEVFNQTRSYILLLFPLAFFIRIAFGFILLKADSFTDILKDSLFLFLGLFFFMDILKLTLQIPHFVASELSFGEWRSVNLGEGLFTKFVKRIVDWIGILSYWISFGLYIVIVSILGFFAGYILFLGTMFRAYGMLKVFFILLFVVSLWPLLWHSINFAVYTIAVSDNALANNVVIGGASVAKVLLPLWLISKTSKIPFSKSLKKISYFGGGLAGMAGSAGSGAYSYVRDKTEHILQKDMSDENNNEEALININQTDEAINPEMEEESPYPKNYISDEPGNFSLKIGDPKQKEDELERLPEGNQSIAIEETPNQVQAESLIHQENKVFQENHQENKILQESHQKNHIENTNQTSIQNQVTKEISSSSNSQVITERKDFIPESNFNENSFTETKYQAPPESIETPSVEKKSIEFNESIHKESWIEEEEDTASHYKPDKDKETEL